MGTEQDPLKKPRRRGRPTGKSNAKPHGSASQKKQIAQGSTAMKQGITLERSRIEAEEEEYLPPFSALLRHILKHDRAEIARVANELGVAENTIYRWMNGNSLPRPVYLKSLLDVLPQHRANLVYAIDQTFPGVLESLSSDIREIQKDIYIRVLDLVANTADDDTRRWQVMQAIFEYALIHLDSERRGLSITFAELMPPQADGKIHSLYEANMRGTFPWPFTLESKAFLGSTTLAGSTASLQRTQTWDEPMDGERMQFVVDEFERSACAHPVMRGGKIAGVLIFSSTQPGFFSKPTIYAAVVEYAQLLILALSEANFYADDMLALRPMPDLKRQRHEITRTFMNRVILTARKEELSRPQAEQRVRCELEFEFEHLDHWEFDQELKTGSTSDENASSMFHLRE